MPAAAETKAGLFSVNHHTSEAEPGHHEYAAISGVALIRCKYANQRNSRTNHTGLYLFLTCPLSHPALGGR